MFLVQPEAIIFGVERQPGTYDRALILLNAGSAEVSLESVSVSGDAVFSVSDLPGFPARLGAGQSIIVRVNFMPTVVGEYFGTVTIATDDPSNASVSPNRSRRRFAW